MIKKTNIFEMAGNISKPPISFVSVCYCFYPYPFECGASPDIFAGVPHPAAGGPVQRSATHRFEALLATTPNSNDRSALLAS